ncbi:MAG: divalent-cation tolerance protein CutA [Rhodospirillaceae bacterium]|nr:divalent-cation tolerance protein CutA [Rhodospirillaceae bacterium]
MALQLVYVTATNAAEAQNLARLCVEARLAACANVIDAMKSYYWWDGAVQSENEAVVIFKTQAAKLDALTRKITSLHSHDCPCVVALDIEGGNDDFLKWIAEQTA